MDDAHNHLQMPKIAHLADDLNQWTSFHKIRRMVVNGTRESDWSDVARLAAQHPSVVRPAFGLHPWHIQHRSEKWIEQLEHYLVKNPVASIGECGLDRWIANHDIDDQTDVLTAHLKLAVSLQRPVTIHCLKAWGPLLETLRSNPIPEQGFLIHAFSGSIETARELEQLGAYFSFSGYFLHPRKSAVCDVYKQISSSRLLIETDAPSMPLPESLQIEKLTYGEKGKAINHPANIVAVRDGLADVLGIKPDELDTILKGNFERIFG